MMAQVDKRQQRTAYGNRDRKHEKINSREILLNNFYLIAK